MASMAAQINNLAVPSQQQQSNVAAQPSTNPFDDNFSDKLLNDNDIFGLEFDRIRHSDQQTNPGQSTQGKLPI